MVILLDLLLKDRSCTVLNLDVLDDNEDFSSEGDRVPLLAGDKDPTGDKDLSIGKLCNMGGIGSSKNW